MLNYSVAELRIIYAKVMYGYILCNNKQELNLSATDAVYEMHENNFLRSLTDLKSPALLHRGLVWGYQYASLL